jgi:virulence-associated protein VagC
MDLLSARRIRIIDSSSRLILTPTEEEADVFTEHAPDLFPDIEEETEFTPAD